MGLFPAVTVVRIAFLIIVSLPPLWFQNVKSSQAGKRHYRDPWEGYLTMVTAP